MADRPSAAVYNITSNNSSFDTFVGLSSEYNTQNGNNLIIGVMYRLQDAAVMNLGYQLKNLTMGISYDFNTSDLNTATSGHGGPEVSLSYIFGRQSSMGMLCPRF